MRRISERRGYRMFALLALICALCAPPVAAADTVQISPANERRLQELLAERNRIGAEKPGQLSAAVSALFLHVPYGANTLIGSASVPEQLVVELTRVDCFTYADYVEALKRSSNRADFIAQLTQIRYHGGEISFTQRRHFFTDWAADAPANAADVTASLGVPAEQVAKILNLKDSGGNYLPGLPTRPRTVTYIPSPRVSDELRIVEVIASDYEGFGPGGLAEDLELGFGMLFQRHSSFKKIAVVTDKEWVAHTLHVLGWMVPGEIALFGLDELDRAKAWASS